MNFPYSYTIFIFLSCMILSFGLFLGYSKKRKKSAKSQADPFWQVKRLEILSLNLTGGTECICKAADALAKEAEKLRRETGCIKGSINAFPESQKNRLLGELNAIENACDLLVSEARRIESKYTDFVLKQR